MRCIQVYIFPQTLKYQLTSFLTFKGHKIAVGDDLNKIKHYVQDSKTNRILRSYIFNLKPHLVTNKAYSW